MQQEQRSINSWQLRSEVVRVTTTITFKLHCYGRWFQSYSSDMCSGTITSSAVERFARKSCIYFKNEHLFFLSDSNIILNNQDNLDSFRYNRFILSI